MRHFSVVERCVIVALVTLVVIGAGIGVAAYSLRLAQAELDARLDLAHQMTSQRVGTAVGVLRSLTAFSQAHDELDMTELASYAGQLRRELPAIRYVGTLLRLEHQDRDWFEQLYRREGMEGFAVRDLVGDSRGPPAAPRDEYLPLAFVDPLTPLTGALLGVDLSMRPAVQALMQESVQSGTVAARLGRIYAGTEAPHLLLAQATYFGRYPPASPDARGAQVSGLILLAVDMQPLLGTIASAHDATRIEFALKDRPRSK